jgi:BirA family biotin operon repressor/biotin-[acetyl-CoA-carboxylase] ligase
VSLIESDSLLSKLRTSKIGQSLLILEECTSTNDIAAQMANAGAPHGFTVFAEKQTKGRGRHGTTWVSPEGGI